MWSANASFFTTVERERERVQSHQVTSSAMYQLLQKLKLLQIHEFKPLKRQYSGALQKVDTLRDEMTRVQDALTFNPNNTTLQMRETDLKI